MASARLPGKPLLDICGLPMIVHVALRSRKATMLDDVFVCTDSRDIAVVCSTYDIPVVLTSDHHLNGTERIAEASQIIGLNGSDVVIDVQGDEALVNPEAIDRVIQFYSANQYDVVVPYDDISYGNDVNRVKIVESGGRILYMSRSAIPHGFNAASPYKKHLSTVAFSIAALQKFAQSPQSILEMIEGVELLRALELNLSVGTFHEEVGTLAVDTQSDLEKVVRMMRSDPYFGSY